MTKVLKGPWKEKVGRVKRGAVAGAGAGAGSGGGGGNEATDYVPDEASFDARSIGLRDPYAVERWERAVYAVDHALVASEAKWGVGRLERLVSVNTLASWRRGWAKWREALMTGNAEGAEELGAKMVAALTYMDGEAEAAGALPLAPETWETPLPDGGVLVVVRTQAEASAVARAAAGKDANLPPDLMVTLRQQHADRALVVLTLPEIARLYGMVSASPLDEIKRHWPDATIGVAYEGDARPIGSAQFDEMAAHRHVRQDPLDEWLR